MMNAEALKLLIDTINLIDDEKALIRLSTTIEERLETLEDSDNDNDDEEDDEDDEDDEEEEEATRLDIRHNGPRDKE